MHLAGHGDGFLVRCQLTPRMKALIYLFSPTGHPELPHASLNFYVGGITMVLSLVVPNFLTQFGISKVAGNGHDSRTT
jgi:hypothetical protein